PMTETHVATDPNPVIVRAAMPYRLRHPPDLLWINRTLEVEIDLAYNAAHDGDILAIIKTSGDQQKQFAAAGLWLLQKESQPNAVPASQRYSAALQLCGQFCPCAPPNQGS